MQRLICVFCWDRQQFFNILMAQLDEKYTWGDSKAMTASELDISTFRRHRQALKALKHHFPRWHAKYVREHRDSPTLTARSASDFKTTCVNCGRPPRDAMPPDRTDALQFEPSTA